MKKNLNAARDRTKLNVAKDKTKLNVVKEKANLNAVKVEKHQNVVRLKLKNKLVILKTRRHAAKERLSQLVALKQVVAKKGLPHAAHLKRLLTAANVANEN